MNKKMMTAAVLALILTICLIVFGVKHPGLSLGLSEDATCRIYGICFVITVLLAAMSFAKKGRMKPLNMLGLIAELCAVYFLVQAIGLRKIGNVSNIFLPIALGFNCLGSLLNVIQQRRDKKEGEVNTEN